MRPSRLMLKYKWPGNVRQLKKITEQMSVLSRGREIDAQTLTQFIPKDEETTQLATIHKDGKEEPQLRQRARTALQDSLRTEGQRERPEA